MGVSVILATIDCDGCGKQFRVELDPAYTPPEHWSLHDVAEDAVRGGQVHQGSFLESCSVQGDKLLCDPCTAAGFAEEGE